MLIHRCRFTILIAALSAGAVAAELVPLIDPKVARGNWKFNNGAEFPGATGSLSLDADVRRDGRDSLKLVGDFTKGGNYVEAGRPIPGVDIRELSLWVRNPDTDRLTFRLNDASGQTHQIAIKTEPGPDWQRVVLPLEEFFARRGEADAVTSVAKYESWGGAKDSAWHGPATAIYILLSNPEGRKLRTLWLSDIAILPRPAEVPGAETKIVVPLDEIIEGAHDWRFSRGEEFPGAKGSLTVAKDEPAPGQTCLKIAGDFTGGGAYVAAIKDLKELDVKDVPAIRLRVKSENAASVGIQLVDGTGQTHQQKGFKITADGQWHDVAIKPSEIAGGEHWGGSNDGKWHGPPKQLAINLTDHSDEKSKQPVLYLADIRADALLAVFVQPPAFKNDFEIAKQLPSGWVVVGDVTIDTTMAFKGSGSLLLSRSLDNVEKPCSATSTAFAVAPGNWEISPACKSDLHSPDNSYNGVVQLELLDAAGAVVDRITVADIFGQHDWQPVRKVIELPKGVASARFQIQLNKTYGRFWLDELSAAYLAPSPRKDDRISRMLFSTAQLGNLLFPNDPRRVSVIVEARKPLRESQRTIAYVVRDYWGAEQMHEGGVPLGAAEKKGDRFVYQAAIDLSDVPLEIGRYYELHAAIPNEKADPFRNYTSFAILPEAATKQYKPEEIPFTSRSWDNRMREHVELSDRLGVRVCGIWGGWSSKPPYKPEAPTLDLCAKLGMGWLTGTPIHKIELGEKQYDETALHQGVRNLIEQFGKVRPMIIGLGNEPHGTGARVIANVATYRAVYEEVKKVDPSIFVIATAVEPNEEYFKAGYGQWCDAYDFHIYAGSEEVRDAIRQYRELMKKYGNAKPIWSTELGLDSQGMTRHAVAVEVIKKFAVFFAAGGANASWFGLLYPDPDAKIHDSSSSAHNIFDCRYSHYAPRLDAIAYYNAVNSIAIKKFAVEKQYPDGISAFLFRDRDNHNLQVLWKTKGRQDVSVPLPGVKEVQVIRIDGSRRTLNACGDGITLTITEDPLLLLYDGVETALPPTLGAPMATVESPAQPLKRGAATTLTVSRTNASAVELNLIAPPFWTVKKSPAQADKRAVQFTLTPPETSSIREADFVITLDDSNGNRRGELYYRSPMAE